MIAGYAQARTKHKNREVTDCKSTSKKALFPANCKTSLAECASSCTLVLILGYGSGLNNMKCIIMKKVGRCTKTGITTQEVISFQSFSFRLLAVCKNGGGVESIFNVRDIISPR